MIGGGHAGSEAALAAAGMGCKTLLVTRDMDKIAEMPCNPAIGGLAKGQLVREIDALGGEMAKAIDATGIQYRMLNRKKGPAVWSPRAQADKARYREYMKNVLLKKENLDVREGEATGIIEKSGSVKGIAIREEMLKCSAVIVTTGTFLNGLIHIGMESHEGGRRGEDASKALSKNLKDLGFVVGRLKTGTPPRLRASSIDYSRTTPQYGESPHFWFSHYKKFRERDQICCYLTRTTSKTNMIIEDNLDRSPLYTGKIVGIGPRYCPSIETKIVRFPGKEEHQVFLEPEGLESEEIYVNGISTSLPVSVQEEVVRSIPGLEGAEILKPGYAIEYDFVPSYQLTYTLETKKIENLYFAGQINGTSGYEEAAAQGIIAGINAALKIRREKPLILQRSEAYIGVLIDDLINREIDEPYRMFTSRAEYRLLLRQDNADQRLMEYGHRVGLLDEEIYRYYRKKKEEVKKIISIAREMKIDPEKVNHVLGELGESEIFAPEKLINLLQRPKVNFDKLDDIVESFPAFSPDSFQEAEIMVKYEGYIRRQHSIIEKIKKYESKKLPENMNYRDVVGLCTEAIEKFEKIRPLNLGQANRISGINPSDISVLMIHLERKRRDKDSGKDDARK